MPKAFVGGKVVDGRQFDRADQDPLLEHDVENTFVGLLRQGSSRSKIEDCYANRNIIPVHVTISEWPVCYHEEWSILHKIHKILCC